MKLDIFDVGHGACSVITCPDGKRLMIDCGSKTDPPYWWPSTAFWGEKFAGLIISNLDEDHLRDFNDTVSHIEIKSVYLNNTIDARRLKLLKNDGMGSGTESLYKFLQNPYNNLNSKLELQQINVHLFRFEYGQFFDTNNLSLVTFIEYGAFCVMFPGDLEAVAWQKALINPNPDFKRLLRRVGLVVPSHHGRDNGCCEELFKDGLCNPLAFVISDKEIIHDTQETTPWYRQYARGVQKKMYPFDMRYVFTTRNDGCISVEAETNGDFTIYPNSGVQRNINPPKMMASPPAPTSIFPGLPFLK